MKLRTRSWRNLALLGIVLGAIWGVILLKSYEPVLGLDLQGGISVALTPAEGATVPEGALDKATDIIRERVDALGVAEPDITKQGDDTIIVQIAGIKADDQERAFQLIGSTAKLSFRAIKGSAKAASPDTPLPTCSDRSTYPRDEPGEERVYCMDNGDGTFQRFTLAPAALTGEAVTGALAELDPQGVQGWFVTLDLNADGSEKFAKVTGQLACNPDGADRLAIVLDGLIRSAPGMGEGVQCNVGIADGKATISGGFSEEEAKDLALVLRYGSLPVELVPVSTETVSPTLGRESLHNGLLAGAIGVAVVFLYVLLFYRVLGAVIWLGILLHAAITYGVIILLGQAAGFSLSLAGIAGLIVSLGIAADSFIVFFERIKDEVVSGKAVRSAVERAWPSARRTIVAADIVTALAAIVLYLLAIGNVRGFALMLGLSTMLDLIVAFGFMRPTVYLISQVKRMRNSRSLGVRAGSEPVVA